MLLFLLASGFSLIYGVGRIANLAHGSLYILGGYIGLSVAQHTGNFWLALLVAPLAGALLGVAIEFALLRRLHGRELEQVLLTVGIAFVLSDVMRWIWGADIRALPPPAALTGLINFFGLLYPKYQLFIVAVGLAVFVVVLLALRSSWGAKMRAVSAGPYIAASLGVPTGAVNSATFAAGTALAAFGGAAGAPIVALAPGLDLTMMLLALIVVVVGGLGSMSGAFIGAIVVALVDGFGRLLFPEYASFLVFALMALVLTFRPQGLLGKLG
jgi:branched-chain amino acid transport system permease protein